MRGRFPASTAEGLEIGIRVFLPGEGSANDFGADAAVGDAVAAEAPEMPAPMTTTSLCVPAVISCLEKRGGRLPCETGRPVRKSLVIISTCGSPVSTLENAR
jgi:hypothetical protein